MNKIHENEFPLNIKKSILETIRASDTWLTSLDLEKLLMRKDHVDRKQIQSAIRDLIEQRTLVYTYRFGHTFLEESFEKPVRITASVVVKPPHCGFEKAENDIVINLRHGVSFGTGRHPTTRLCLKGMAHINSSSLWMHRETKTLDIGTGAGLLIITAVKMGITNGLGIDVDPCALFEAKENVKLNRLESAIHISDQPVQEIKEKFSLIIANLRLPTIKQIFPHLCQITKRRGFMVLSGIMADELMTLKALSQAYGLIWVCELTENRWAAAVIENSAV